MPEERPLFPPFPPRFAPPGPRLFRRFRKASTFLAISWASRGSLNDTVGTVHHEQSAAINTRAKKRTGDGVIRRWAGSRLCRAATGWTSVSQPTLLDIAVSVRVILRLGSCGPETLCLPVPEELYRTLYPILQKLSQNPMTLDWRTRLLLCSQHGGRRRKCAKKVQRV